MSKEFLLLLLLQVTISACSSTTSQDVKIEEAETLLLISSLLCILCVFFCLICLLRIKNFFNSYSSHIDYNETKDVTCNYKKKDENIKMHDGYEGLFQRQKDLENEVKRIKLKLEKQNHDINVRYNSHGNFINSTAEKVNKKNSSGQENNLNEIMVSETIPKPNNSKYLYLKVVDGGRLADAQNEENAYYRAWNYNGSLYFEFSTSKVMKAINNRASVIEPLCDIVDGTVEPDNASAVYGKAVGKLNSDYTIIEKVKIKYGTK